jgi:hypothetical protein
MPDQTIKCPKCGTEIPLTEALTGQIEQSIKLKYEQEFAESLNAERKTIAETERRKILDEQAEQTKALEGELEEKNQKLKEFQRQELELRKQQRKLQEEKDAFALEAARKLDEERKKIAEEAGKKAADEQMLKMREKDDLIKAMQEQIESLKRKSETGSQEAQGEALEGLLQEYLERSFPYDKFEEVKKGQRGADILQIVLNKTGKECGKILWESKNTKAFQKGWIEKLKNDQMEANANIAVIMTVALPEGMDSFGQYEGVWVTDYKSSIGLATALRLGIIEVQKQRIISENQEGAKDLLYAYITSQEFIMKVRAVVDAFNRMQNELETEKRAMTKIWNSREKQIRTVIENITGFYGSIEGLVGDKKALPEIKPLSLESVIEEEKENPDEMP